jgi:hypothetical protein
MQNGLIALAKEGESIVYSHKFYPAFATKDEYEIIFNDNLIGFIDLENVNIDVGENIIISGAQWQIIGIKKEIKKVLVKRSTGGKAVFANVGRGGVEHKKIHEKMRDIYEGKITNFPYLDESARLLLQEGIEEYKIVKNNSLLIFGGARMQNTVRFVFLNSLNDRKDFLEDLYVGFYHPGGKEFLRNVLKEVNITRQKIYDVLIEREKLTIGANKFDYLLPKELLVEEYIESNFELLY